MAGAGTMAGFSPLLWSSVCEAQVAAPLRFVALWTAHGRLDEFWTPRGGETDFDINFPSATLQPLQPFRSQLLILDGVDYRVLYEYGTPGHEGGPATFLTGAPVELLNGEPRPRSESMDQFLAGKLAGVTRLRSLHLSTYSRLGEQTVHDSLSFAANGARVPWQRDPSQVWSRLFSTLSGVAPTPSEVRALGRKKSLLDYLVRDAARLQARLAGPERTKLDAHLAALRDIEARLNQTTVDCARPPAPSAQSSEQLSDLMRAPENTRLLLELAAQALACDLTRVVTVAMLPGPSAPWLGITESLHDDLAHHVNVADATLRLSIRGKLNAFHRWNAQNVAHLLAALQRTNDGAGSLLDHSLVLWGNELSDPDVHACHSVPWLLAGGANGKLRMGRYLQLRPGKEPLAGWGGVGDKAPNAVAHNQVLVGLLRTFGHEVDAFGHPDYRGALAGL